MSYEGPWLVNDGGLTDNPYPYNGKELHADFGLGWYAYGARWYDPSIGRFTTVDPLAGEAPGWTPFRYGFNNPVLYLDPDGLFESKYEAKQYAKDNNIRVGGLFGFLRSNKIKEQRDGTFAIENEKAKTSTSRLTDDEGNDLGVMTGVMVSPTDIISLRIEGEQNMFTGGDQRFVNVHRDGTETDGGPTVITGMAPTPGKGKLPRIPKGQAFWDIVKKRVAKGGEFMRRDKKGYLRVYKEGERASRTPTTHTSTTPSNVDRSMEEFLKNAGRLLNKIIKDGPRPGG